MKKRCLWVVLAIVLSLCACGGQEAEPAAEVPTWQEQYDLGIRYLSEGNYEEAIIAFTAAIEIDPKQAEAYIGLADVYTAQGDTEKAVEVLNQALEAVGENEEIAAALETLQAKGSARPSVPQEIMHDNNFDGDYIACTEDMFRLFTPAIEAGAAGEWQTMQTLLWEIFPEVTDLPEMSDLPCDYETFSMFSFWTQLPDGEFLDILYYDDEQSKQLGITYRPESGIGFHCHNNLRKDGQGDIWDIWIGQMEGYLWNGSFRKYHDYRGPEDLRGSIIATGSAINEMLHGEYTEEWYSYESATVRETLYWIYDHGIQQLCWQSEDGPRSCKRIYADGHTWYTGDEKNEVPYLVY